MFQSDYRSAKPLTADYLHMDLFLSKELKLLFPFPTRDQVLQWMPASFKRYFPWRCTSLYIAGVRGTISDVRGFTSHKNNIYFKS